jgi:3-oxoadipate enol-lactonase/4-carboxymuconolactone decarboxylase
LPPIGEAEVGTVEHRGAEIGYQVDGPEVAPVLLLSNSLGTTTAVWDDVVPALAQRFSVVRYDHRGHGASGTTPGPYDIELLATDALAVLDDLAVERASICGLSIGGAVALWIATHFPERVERLAVCCSAARFGSPADWTERARLVRDQGPLALLDVLMERWFTAGFAGRPEVRQRVAAMLGAVSPEGYAACCEALAEYDVAGELGRIAAPTLVLGGALDVAAPPEAAFELASGIDQSTLVVLADTAHLAVLEQSARVTEALVAHLSGPAAERGEHVRRRVLGDEHVARSRTSQTPETAPFVDLVTRLAWGEVWTRPALDLRIRSCVTVAMLIALGRFDELELHLRGAERNGVSRDELVEVLLQSAIYCGFPAANQAFALAKRVFGNTGG